MNVGVYLGYAIDQDQKPPGVAHIKTWLTGQKTVSWVFDPGAAFVPGLGDRTPDIRAINAEALDRAGVMVAVLPAGTVSVGVPMEIDRAARAGKAVLVISDAPSWMLEFDTPNVGVFNSWNGFAQTWLSGVLDGGLPGLGVPTRAPMPVVVSEGAEEPRRGYDDDAGLDLVVSESRLVRPGRFVDIPCGVSVQLPDWSWGMITGRSSTLRKRGLMVNQGIIDAGYRGPLFAGVWNLTKDPVVVDKGERIAQLIVLHNGTREVEVKRVEALEPSERGANGFGSTGV